MFGSFLLAQHCFNYSPRIIKLFRFHYLWLQPAGVPSVVSALRFMNRPRNSLFLRALVLRVWAFCFQLALCIYALPIRCALPFLFIFSALLLFGYRIKRVYLSVIRSSLLLSRSHPIRDLNSKMFALSTPHTSIPLARTGILPLQT